MSTVSDRVDELLHTDHFDEDVRRELLSLGPEAHGLLQDYAAGGHESGDPDVQGRAIVALGESGDDALAVPALRAAMQSLDADTRVRAIHSLGRVGGGEATAILHAAVHAVDALDGERAHGIRALARLDTAEARASLEGLSTQPVPEGLAGEINDALGRMTA